MLYHGKKYWYYKYLPISCDLCTEFDYFTPKYNILWLIQPGNIYYRLHYIIN